MDAGALALLHEVGVLAALFTAMEQSDEVSDAREFLLAIENGARQVLQIVARQEGPRYAEPRPAQASATRPYSVADLRRRRELTERAAEAPRSDAGYVLVVDDEAANRDLIAR
jgi:hypothetical protein